MRKLVWLLIVLAVLWGAWWATATTQMQSTLTGLLDTRRAAGWEVTLKDISKSGFPLALQNRLSGLAVAAPARSLAFEAPQLGLVARRPFSARLGRKRRAACGRAAFDAEYT